MLSSNFCERTAPIKKSEASASIVSGFACSPSLRIGVFLQVNIIMTFKNTVSCASPKLKSSPLPFCRSGIGATIGA